VNFSVLMASDLVLTGTSIASRAMRSSHFDFYDGRCFGAIIGLPRLYGQAIDFFETPQPSGPSKAAQSLMPGSLSMNSKSLKSPGSLP
jgi:hypothetical protein